MSKDIIYINACEVCGYRVRNQGELFDWSTVDNRTLQVCSKCLVVLNDLREEQEDKVRRERENAGL